jgi:hypothetical protein
VSADNWTFCPRCYAAHLGKMEAAKASLANKYGTVDEYDRMKHEMEANPPRLNSSLAERFECGVKQHGEFFVNFRCYCKTCGFSFEFKHEQQVPLDGN